MKKKIGRIAVVGTGSWGTAIAYLVSRNINKVLFFGADKYKTEDFNYSHINRDYFPDILIPEHVIGVYEKAHIADAEIFILAVPAQGLRKKLIDLIDIFALNSSAPLVICSKGIENDSNKLMSQIVIDLKISNPVVILSGPNFAKEIMQNKISTTTIASKNEKVLDRVEEIFSNENFRVEKISDVIGLQICGAIKNVYAIATGIAHGLELGENFHAALMKRITTELYNILDYLNADPKTVFTYGGIGDLFLTCSSTTSRNFEFGNLITKNYEIKNLLTEKTIEGYYTTLSIQKLLDCDKFNITTLIYNILYKNASLEELEGVI